MSNYKPRRSSDKWLAGAPEYILAVYDKPSVLDRYTVLLGGSLLEPQLLSRRLVHALALSDNPSNPMGVSLWLELNASDRSCLGKKVRWLDIPDNVRSHIKARVA